MENQNIFIDKNEDQIDAWAFVEIMGHDTIAGRISERKVGIQVMIQVDVPKDKEGFEYSKLFSPSSIFSIQPTTEEWCRKYVANRRNLSILPYIPNERQLPNSENVDIELGIGEEEVL